MNAYVSCLDGSTLEVVAQRTKTPGLIIHRPLTADPEGWTVTHAPSGLALAWFAKLATARRFAQEVGALGDWTADKPTTDDIDQKHFKLIKACCRIDEGSEP